MAGRKKARKRKPAARRRVRRAPPQRRRANPVRRSSSNRSVRTVARKRNPKRNKSILGTDAARFAVWAGVGAVASAVGSNNLTVRQNLDKFAPEIPPGVKMGAITLALATTMKGKNRSNLIAAGIGMMLPDAVPYAAGMLTPGDAVTGGGGTTTNKLTQRRRLLIASGNRRNSMVEMSRATHSSTKIGL